MIGRHSRVVDAACGLERSISAGLGAHAKLSAKHLVRNVPLVTFPHWVRTGVDPSERTCKMPCSKADAI